MVNGGDRRTKGWMDEKMDGRKDGQKDGRLEIPPCSTGHRPFGAAAQKGLLMSMGNHRFKVLDKDMGLGVAILALGLKYGPEG